MEIWSGTQNSPVYYGQTVIFDAGIPAMAGNSFDALYDVAQQYFNTIVGTPGVKTSTGALLVAALWDPTANVVWASTIPRSNLVKFMKDQGPSRAPVWWAQSGTLPVGATYHAEDGAYFAMEYLAERGNTGATYAAGTKMAVWGFKGSDSDDEKVTGRRVALCPSSRNCQVQAGNLGVAFDPDAMVKRDTDDGEDDDGDYSETCDDAILVPLDPAPPGEPTAAGKRRSDRVPAVQKRFNVKKRGLGLSARLGMLEGRQDASSAAAASDSICTDASTVIVTDSYDPTPTVAATGDTSSFPITSFVTATPTADPSSSFSCSYQGDDPDQGIDSAYCVCTQGPSTVTAALPRNSAGIWVPSGTNSCPYSDYPATVAVTPTNGLGPATTNLMNCQVCSPVVVNEDSCTSIPNCIPQYPVATVSVGSSPVNVGTLTGTALYSSVSNALESLCPEVTQTTALTQCSGAATIPDIAYPADDDLQTDGELQVVIGLSGYNSTQLRDALISSLAASAQQAATGSNCYVPEGSAGLGDAPPGPDDTLCNSAWFYEADYYNPWWREAPEPGPTDFIHATIEFHTAPNSFNDFVCEFIDLMIDALAVIEPEFAIEDLELEEGINIICENQEGDQTEGSTDSN